VFTDFQIEDKHGSLEIEGSEPPSIWWVGLFMFFLVNNTFKLKPTDVKKIIIIRWVFIFVLFHTYIQVCFILMKWKCDFVVCCIFQFPYETPSESWGHGQGSALINGYPGEM
jgi:hypothetical protein